MVCTRYQKDSQVFSVPRETLMMGAEDVVQGDRWRLPGNKGGFFWGQCDFGDVCPCQLFPLFSSLFFSLFPSSSLPYSFSLPSPPSLVFPLSSFPLKKKNPNFLLLVCTLARLQLPAEFRRVRRIIWKVTSSYEPHGIGAGSQTQVLCKGSAPS